MDASVHDNTRQSLFQDVLPEPCVDTKEEANYQEGGATTSLVTGSEDACSQDLPQMSVTDVEKGKISTTLTDETVGDGTNSGESDDETVLVGDSWIEESSTLVCVPVPGMPITAEVKRRNVPNGCAICLSLFIGGDRVTWSATPSDPHVFHEHCMLRYLNSVGSKAARSRQQNQHQGAQNQVEDAMDFAML